MTHLCQGWMSAARIGSLLASAPRCSLATSARGIHTSSVVRAPKSLLTLADLSTSELDGLVRRAAELKGALKRGQPSVHPSLAGKSIGILFTKRSTRTRIASETSVATLGGHPMFLSPSDIQLGVNESLYDTVRVVSSMVDGIMARVGGHDEIEVSAPLRERQLTRTDLCGKLAGAGDQCALEPVPPYADPCGYAYDARGGTRSIVAGAVPLVARWPQGRLGR